MQIKLKSNQKEKKYLFITETNWSVGSSVALSKVCSKLTKLSGNSVLHQHVFNYNYISFLKRRRHLSEHTNGHRVYYLILSL